MSDIQWANPIDLEWIPNGKLVTFTAMHQAGDTQYFQVLDNNNNPISFSPLAGSFELAPSFPVSGVGSDVGFFVNGYGSFTKADGMHIQFGSTAPSPPSVVASPPYQFFADNACRGGGTMYVTEDGGDSDYNDTAVVLQWYGQAG
jgi:hypothetical protein